MDPDIGRCHRGRLIHGSNYDVIMTDYRDAYLDALESSTWDDTSPVYHFIEYSYLAAFAASATSSVATARVQRHSCLFSREDFKSQANRKAPNP